jgi:hypothetical protein
MKTILYNFWPWSLRKAQTPPLAEGGNSAPRAPALLAVRNENINCIRRYCPPLF